MDPLAVLDPFADHPGRQVGAACPPGRRWRISSASGRDLRIIPTPAATWLVWEIPAAIGTGAYISRVTLGTFKNEQNDDSTFVDLTNNL